jgi:hypothetical protein
VRGEGGEARGDLPDVEVVDVGHAGVGEDRLGDRGRRRRLKRVPRIRSGPRRLGQEPRHQPDRAASFVSVVGQYQPLALALAR